MNIHEIRNKWAETKNTDPMGRPPKGAAPLGAPPKVLPLCSLFLLIYLLYYYIHIYVCVKYIRNI